MTTKTFETLRETRKNGISAEVMGFVTVINGLLDVENCMEIINTEINSNPFQTKFSKQVKFEIDTRELKIPASLAKQIVEKVLSETEKEIAGGEVEYSHSVITAHGDESILKVSATVKVEFKDFTMEDIDKMLPIRADEEGNLWATQLKEFHF